MSLDEAFLEQERYNLHKDYLCDPDECWYCLNPGALIPTRTEVVTLTPSVDLAATSSNPPTHQGDKEI